MYSIRSQEEIMNLPSFISPALAFLALKAFHFQENMSLGESPKLTSALAKTRPASCHN
jgi:hypothetical protein